MTLDWANPLFALALPPIVIEGKLGMQEEEGVTSASTDAMAFTARVGIVQEMVEPCSLPQVPVPLVIEAVGVVARQEVGNPVAVKNTRFAGSVPLGLELVMSNTNSA